MNRSSVSTSYGAGLLGDHGPEAELDVRAKPIRELLGGAVPERVVVLEVAQRGLVVGHRLAPHPLRLGLGVADRHLDPKGELDLRRIPTDRGAVLAQDVDLVGHHVGRSHRVPQVGVLGHRAQGLLLAGPADHDRKTALDRRRRVAQVVEGVAPARSGGDRPPGQDLLDRVDRLLEPVEPLAETGPEVDPVGLVLGSIQAPPMPRIARPPLMWSSVAASLATSPGLRKVLAPTSSPRRVRSVAMAQAASAVQPSKIGWYGSPKIAYRWSHVQRWS